jgi:hypothetical protein
MSARPPRQTVACRGMAARDGSLCIPSPDLSSEADRDLNDIWDYIAADNIDAPDRWIEKLFDAF